MAGVDYAIDQGFAGPERLGVGGWSYGGILTIYVITKTDRFKGAITGASEVLFRSNYGHDHYQLQWEKELGLLWENAGKVVGPRGLEPRTNGYTSKLTLNIRISSNGKAEQGYCC